MTALRFQTGVNHGSSQQSCKEEYEPWTGGATTRYAIMHLIRRPCYRRGSLYQDPVGNRTTRKPSDLRNETQTEVVRTSLPFKSGQDPSCKLQRKGEEDKADRKGDGKTTSRNEQAWRLPCPRGQWRTEKSGVICGAPMISVVKGRCR